MMHKGKQANPEEDAFTFYIAQRIKLRRTELGLSQKDLSRLLNVTFQQVQKYETARDRIYSNRLCIIARNLGVDLNYFWPKEGSNLMPGNESNYATRGNLEAMKGLSDVPRPVRDAICKLIYSVAGEERTTANPRITRSLEIQARYPKTKA